MFVNKLKTAAAKALKALVQYRFDIFVYFGLFVMFFLPPLFQVGSVRINALYVVGFPSIAILLYKFYFLKILKRKENLWIIGGFALLLIYGFVQVLRFSTPFSNMASQLHLCVNVLPFSFVVAKYCKDRGFSLGKFLDMVIAVATAQAILGVLTMLIPPLKQLFINMLLDYGYPEVLSKIPHRMFGFSGELTFATPIAQSMIAIICFYLCFVKSQKYYIPMVLLAFTSIVNARTSVIALAIGVIVVLCFSKQWGWKHTLKTLKIPLYCLPVAALGVVILSFVMPTTVEWVLTGIGEIFSLLTGNSDTPTFNFLFQSNWWKLPEGLPLIFGVGSKILYGYENLEAGIMRVASDVGYINDIWYGGILFAVIQYAFFYSMFLMMRKYQPQLSFFAIFLMVVMPILNIKGIAFTFSGFINLITIFAVLTVNLDADPVRRLS